MYPWFPVGIVYLAALILGLGTIALQFILAHAGDADVHTDHDIDVGDHDVDGDVHHEGPGGAPGDGAFVGLFLSMRFWTYALLAFGMVGAAAHFLHLAGATAVFVTALTMGVAAGLAASMLFRVLKPGVSSATTSAETVGRMARVTVPLRKGGLGKVRVEIKGKRVDLLATTDADDDIAAGTEVVVVEFRGEQAHVEPIGTRQDKP